MVYTGGDDLLALSPAGSALHIAQQVRAAVDEHLMLNGKKLTASTAIVFFRRTTRCSWLYDGRERHWMKPRSQAEID